MEGKVRIGVIFGGRSGEHEVSLMSARSVLSVLSPDKYEVVPVGIDRSGKWFGGQDLLEKFSKHDFEGLYPVTFLPESGCRTLYAVRRSGETKVLEPVAELDVIFPVLHGTFGEDGTIQGLFEMADIAYVGAGVLGSAVGMDKALFKDLMRQHRLPVVDSVIVNRSQIENNIDQVIELSQAVGSYPLFVKPANLGSSVGITRCRGRADLVEGLMEASYYDRRVLVERGVNAREIEVSVLGNDDPVASIPGEIRPRQEFYTYDAKYRDESTELLIPAVVDADTSARLQDLAVRAYKACDCAGMARVDFLLDKDTGEVFIGEINTIPGFTRISMYPKLWEASGLPYADLVDRLIQLAFERKNQRDQTGRDYGSAA